MARELTPFIATSGAKRRSTRVAHAVPILVRWVNRRAIAITETAATVSINCHGFRYFSRQRPRKNSPVTFQIFSGKDDNRACSPVYPGRVAWIRKSKRLDGLYVVGVELAIPLNIWGLDEVPDDWIPCSPGMEQDSDSFLSEVEEILRSARSASYYQLLNVEPDTPTTEVKRHFYQLALRFHPDHHMDHPEWSPRLAKLMESLTAAYKTLIDDAAKKEYDAALSSQTGEVKPEPRSLARGHLEKAHECMAERNFSGCILWLHRAIECEPNNSSHRALLGRCLSAIPEYRREAIEQFEMAIQLDSRNLTAHLHYGELLETLKAPSRAKSHYLRVLELDATHRGARERLSRMGIGVPRSATSKPSLLRRLTGRTLR